MTAREQAAQETTEVEEPEVAQEVMEQVKYREAARNHGSGGTGSGSGSLEQDIFPEEEARITGISLMHGSCSKKYGEKVASICRSLEDGLKLAEKYGDDLASIIDNLEPTEAKKAVSLINSYGDDALEMFKEGKSFDEVKKVVEGAERHLPKLQRSWQGKGKYPGIDDYVDITVKRVLFYIEEPNGTEYFTTLDAIEQSGRDATKLFEGLQVEKNPKYGYRGEMQGYVFNEDVCECIWNSKRKSPIWKRRITTILCSRCSRFD